MVRQDLLLKSTRKRVELIKYRLNLMTSTSKYLQKSTHSRESRGLLMRRGVVSRVEHRQRSRTLSETHSRSKPTSPSFKWVYKDAMTVRRLSLTVLFPHIWRIRKLPTMQ